MQAAPSFSSSPHGHALTLKKIVLCEREVRNQLHHRHHGIEKPTSIAVAGGAVLVIGLCLRGKQRRIARLQSLQSLQGWTPRISSTFGLDRKERKKTSKKAEKDKREDEPEHIGQEEELKKILKKAEKDKREDEPEHTEEEEEADNATQQKHEMQREVFGASILRQALDEGREAVRKALKGMKELATEMDGLSAKEWESLMDVAALEVRKEAEAKVAMDIISALPLMKGGYIRYFRRQLVLHQMERRDSLKRLLTQAKKKFVKEMAPEVRRVLLGAEDESGMKWTFEVVSTKLPTLYPGDIGILVPSKETDEEANWAVRDFWMVRMEPADEDMEESGYDDDIEGELDEGNRLIKTWLLPHVSRTSAGGQVMAPPPFHQSFRLFTLPNLPYERRVAAMRSICCLPSVTMNRFSSRMRDIVLAPPEKAEEAANEELEELPPWNSSLTCDEFRDILSEWFPEAADLKISEQQLQVVLSALEQPLSIIQGPPGTGKSHVASIIIAAMVALRHSQDQEEDPAERVLVVAESNAAVDNLCRAARRLGINGIRLGVGASRDLVWKPDRNSPLEQAQQLRRELREADAVFTTCLSSARVALSQSGNFRRVIVDEAAQALEASVLIPLSLNCKQLVLIGDHKQLPPVVTSIMAKNRGLGKSLFERLVATEVALPLFLAEQRRMHSSIAEFPSKQFYGSRLANAISDEDRPSVSGFPWPRAGASADCRVCFVDIGKEHGKERMEPCFSPSRPVEAEHVAQVVRRITKAGLSSKKLCVLTPYHGQRQVLQEELINQGVFQVLPKTVDSYQGMELDLVIISTTRIGKSIGFLKDEQRTNVMLTRARRGLIVFGHGATLRQSNTVWSAWHKWVEEKGCVLRIEDLTSNKQWA